MSPEYGQFHSLYSFFQPFCVHACQAWPWFLLLLLLTGDSLARALAGSGICLGFLSTHRQSSPVAQTTIAAEVHESLDVHRHFATQITLNLTFTVNNLTDLGYFILSQIIRAGVVVNT